MEYQLYANYEKRLKTEYIIILHANNLILESHPGTSLLLRGSYKYSWGSWQDYLIKRVNKKKLPMHYFVEFLGNDYACFTALENNRPSYFIDEQITNAVIDAKYKNALVVVIGENFSEDIPDPRLMDQMAQKVLLPLMRQYKLDWSRIMYYDECLTSSFVENLPSKPMNNRFGYTPMIHFDMSMLRNAIVKFDR